MMYVRQVLRMNKRLLSILLLTVLCLTGCGHTAQIDEEEMTMSTETYLQISQEEAKKMMDEGRCDVILDVREQNEYAEKHIPGAKLLPLGAIDEGSASDVIPAEDSVVLVYCRSGRRSKIAAQQLAEMGYTNIYEFGGIIDWPYEVE